MNEEEIVEPRSRFSRRRHIYEGLIVRKSKPVSTGRGPRSDPDSDPPIKIEPQAP